MFKIDDNYKIHITRGDIGSLEITAKISETESYIFKVGDVVRFQVMKAKDCSSVVLSKSVTIGTQSTTATLSLSSTDTRIGTLINKPAIFWYEIELNPETNAQTIIGYDEDGPKEFVLYPEGAEADD